MVAFEEKFILENLWQLYEYDMSQYEEDGGPNDYGLFGRRYFDHYWTDKGRYPYFIKISGKLAGFVLVSSIRNLKESGNDHPMNLSHSDVTHSVGEFFVLRNYRRKGIGKFVAHRIFDMFPGKWRVSQMENNQPSQEFWRKIISEYTNGDYLETTCNRRPVQKFYAFGQC
jgi:predicted acetyltransferase